LQFKNNCLHERRQRDRVVHARLHVADPKLDRVEKRVQPDEPREL
jgi:hypothetical protein